MNRRTRLIVRLAAPIALIASALPVWAHAQVPGLPVLQNAFSTKGFTLAANGGGGGEGWSAVGALGLGAASGRLALAGGLGAFTPDRASGARTAWGVRVSGTFFTFASGALGVGAFVGFGGAGGGHIDPGPAPGDTTMTNAPTRLPLGVALGYRHLFGGVGVSLYTSPHYVWYNKGGTNANSSSVFRVPVGLDIGFARRFGLTLGAEFGADAAHGSLGPQGASYAAGFSYVLRRR